MGVHYCPACPGQPENSAPSCAWCGGPTLPREDPIEFPVECGGCDGAPLIAGWSAVRDSAFGSRSLDFTNPCDCRDRELAEEHLWWALYEPWTVPSAERIGRWHDLPPMSASSWTRHVSVTEDCRVCSADSGEWCECQGQENVVLPAFPVTLPHEHTHARACFHRSHWREPLAPRPPAEQPKAREGWDEPKEAEARRILHAAAGDGLREWCRAHPQQEADHEPGNCYPPGGRTGYPNAGPYARRALPDRRRYCRAHGSLIYEWSILRGEYPAIVKDPVTGKKRRGWRLMRPDGEERVSSVWDTEWWADSDRQTKAGQASDDDWAPGTAALVAALFDEERWGGERPHATYTPAWIASMAIRWALRGRSDAAAWARVMGVPARTVRRWVQQIKNTAPWSGLLGRHQVAALPNRRRAPKRPKTETRAKPQSGPAIRCHNTATPCDWPPAGRLPHFPEPHHFVPRGHFAGSN